MLKINLEKLKNMKDINQDVENRIINYYIDNKEISYVDALREEISDYLGAEMLVNTFIKHVLAK